MLLRARGWTVISVPSFEWYKLDSQAARQAYLCSLLPDKVLATQPQLSAVLAERRSLKARLQRLFERLAAAVGGLLRRQ